MEFVINADQLRKALLDIERAEANGFMHCEAVFFLASAGPSLGQCVAVYSDLSEKAHPTNAALDWGRYPNVTRHNRCVDGELVRIVG